MYTQRIIYVVDDCKTKSETIYKTHGDPPIVGCEQTFQVFLSRDTKSDTKELFC